MARERTLRFAASSLNCEGSVAVTNWSRIGLSRLPHRRVAFVFTGESCEEGLSELGQYSIHNL
jgi:hypothetical protein